MLKLENHWLLLSLDPESCRFSLSQNTSASDTQLRANFGLILDSDPRHYLTLRFVSASEIQTTETHQGLCELIELIYQSIQNELQIKLRFALPREYPLLLQQMELVNQSDKSVFPEKFIFSHAGRRDLILTSHKTHTPVFLNNGWQSWSPSGVCQRFDRQQRTRLGRLASPMVDNPGTPITRRPAHFSSDMFALIGDRISRNALVAGFLSQKQHFGSLECRTDGPPEFTFWANGDTAELLPGYSITTDWAAYAFANLSDASPLKSYLEAVNRENEIRLPVKPPVGWCSWYYYFTKVDARDIRQNLNEILSMRDSLPLNLLQIDDGYQKDVGSWLEFNKKFPQGVKPLADEIRSGGLTPGIWLAPYIVEKKSALRKKHPEWLLKDAKGKPANAGFGWGRLTTALDLTIPEALDYTTRVIRTAVQEWGFPYLKLDFLYAAAVKGIYQDPTKTRAQVLRMGLESIRQAAGEETMLLACGCPVGSALGLFDLMRISADVGPTWEPEFKGIQAFIRNEPNMPSARNAIHNILSRADQDSHWWGNDPDCLLVRPDSKLTLAEVQSLATAIGITGGAMLISDDLTQLPEERLRIAQSLIPVLPGNPVMLDRFESAMPSKIRHTAKDALGDYQLAAMFNWSDQPADLTFRLSDWQLSHRWTWMLREFWTGEVGECREEYTFHNVPPHGARLLALRPQTGEPLYLGSDLHFSQGTELTRWELRPDGLGLTLSLGREAAGKIYLYLPESVQSVWADGEQISIIDGGEEKILSIPVSLTDKADIWLSFQA